MKIKRWKYFADYEKEEQWLNAQVAKGLAMVDYSFCRYTFEGCRPGEYIYRIELLNDRVPNPDSIKYLQFMEASGAEEVASYLNWVYFRRPAADGPFEIYSDLDSRIAYTGRLVRLWSILTAMIGFGIVAQIVGTVGAWLDGDWGGASMWVVRCIGLVAAVFSVVFVSRFLPRYVRRLRQMKHERTIRE